MKITKENVLIAAVILFLLAALGWQQIRIKKLDESGQLNRIRLSMYEDSVTVLEDKNHNLTFKIASIEVDASSDRKALEAAGYDIKDLKAREIKWRSINFALEAQIEALGEGKIALMDTIVKGDTIRQAAFNYTTPYLSFSGLIGQGELDFNYHYQTKINLLQETRGRSIIVSAYLSDPNAAIISANSITITPKEHWYNSKWLYLGAGFVTGAILVK